MLVARPPSERVVDRLVRWVMVASVLGVACTGALALAFPGGRHVLDYGELFSTGHGKFSIRLYLDTISLIFLALATTLCGVVAAFSSRYLQREPGYARYFLLFSIFTSGIQLIALAGSIEVLFAGWELLGLSSALLVAFFHERRSPVANGLRVFTVYRISDAALLMAAVLVHHEVGSGDLLLVFSSDAAGGELSQASATWIASLLFLAVACKSALLPFSGWLPRAMEGPTPSSAVYYGALSVHAGCYLLLRAAPLLEQAPVVRGVALIVGLSTAVYATFVARAQADVKSSMAFASLSQVSLIVSEIALGWYRIAFVHLIGHACFRLLQLLMAPNILKDFEQSSAGEAAPIELRGRQYSFLPQRLRRWLFVYALERGFLDGLIERSVVRPFLKVVGALDAFDRLLCGHKKPGGK